MAVDYNCLYMKKLDYFIINFGGILRAYIQL